jgi:hypothetical protein
MGLCRAEKAGCARRGDKARDELLLRAKPLVLLSWPMTIDGEDSAVTGGRYYDACVSLAADTVCVTKLEKYILHGWHLHAFFGAMRRWNGSRLGPAVLFACYRKRHYP